MARRYKFHKTYAVIWYDRSVERYYYKVVMTKREAKEYAASLERVIGKITHIEIVKRLWAFNYYDGRIPLEAL